MSYLLKVVEASTHSDAYRRIVFTGKGIGPLLKAPDGDAYVKLFFFPEGIKPPQDGDMKTLQKSLAPKERPQSRSYTIAAVNKKDKTLTIDFTRHSNGGVGSAWAETAAPGSWVYAFGPRGKYSPDPKADAIIVLADTPGIPAARRVIERAKHPKRLRVIFDTTLSHEELDLPEKVGSVTLIDSGRGKTTLRDEVGRLKLPKGGVEVFARGEKYVTKKLLGQYFRELGLPSKRVSISGYWSAPKNDKKR